MSVFLRDVTRGTLLRLGKEAWSRRCSSLPIG